MEESALRSGVLWRAGAALLLALLPFSAYAALLPLVRDAWGIDNVRANLVFSAYLAGYAVSALLLVPQADRHPPQRLWVAGLVLMTIAHGLFPLLARGVAGGALLRMTAGAGHVLAMTAGINLLARRFPRQRAAAVGFFTAAGYIGTTSSYVVTGRFLALSGDWRAAYGASVALAAAAVPLALWAAKGLAVVPAAEPAPAGAGRLDWRLLHDPALRRTIFAYAWHSGDLYVARLWLPLLLGTVYTAAGLPPADAAARAATLAGAMFVASAGGVFAGGWLADAWGRRPTALVIYGGGVAASATIGWLVGGPPALLIAVGFAYALLSAADSSLFATLIVEQAPPGRVAAAQAIQAFIGFGVGAIWPVLAGQVLDWGGELLGWGGILTLNALFVATGLPALVRLREKR